MLVNTKQNLFSIVTGVGLIAAYCGLVAGASLSYSLNSQNALDRAMATVFNYGHSQFEKHNYDVAEKIFLVAREYDKLVSLDLNSDIEYWNTQAWLARVKEAQGNFDEAEILFKDALRISKNNKTPGYNIESLSMYYLSNFYAQHNRTAEARSVRETGKRLEKLRGQLYPRPN